MTRRLRLRHGRRVYVSLDGEAVPFSYLYPTSDWPDYHSVLDTDGRIYVFHRRRLHFCPEDALNAL